MKVVITKDGKSVEAEIPDEQFEKLFVEEKKKTGYERVENNKFYWFMDSGLEEIGVMTNDISKIRKYISTKPMQKNPTWTNRDKPDWWEV